MDAIPCPFPECDGKLEAHGIAALKLACTACKWITPTCPTPEAALAAAKRVRVLATEHEASEDVKLVRRWDREHRLAALEQLQGEARRLREERDLAWSTIDTEVRRLNEITDAVIGTAEDRESIKFEGLAGIVGRLRTERDDLKRQLHDAHRKIREALQRAGKESVSGDGSTEAFCQFIGDIHDILSPKPAGGESPTSRSAASGGTSAASGVTPAEPAGKGDPIEPTNAEMEALRERLCSAYYAADNGDEGWRNEARAAYTHIGQEALKLRREVATLTERLLEQSRQLVGARKERDAALAKLEAVRQWGAGLKVHVELRRLLDILDSDTPPKPQEDFRQAARSVEEARNRVRRGQTERMELRREGARSYAVPVEPQEEPEHVDDARPYLEHGNGPIQPLQELWRVVGNIEVAFGVRHHGLVDNGGRLKNAIREHLAKVERLESALRTLIQLDDQDLGGADESLAILNGKEPTNA